MVGDQWSELARELARVVHRSGELEKERALLAVQRERIERELAELLVRETDGQRFRVPAWLDQGAAVQRGVLARDESVPAAELAVVCPRLEGGECGVPQEDVHTHYANGKIIIWDEG